MEHLQSFQQYNEGFLSKAAATAALGISALAPQKAHGQLGHKIKDFVKKEVRVVKNTATELNDLRKELKDDKVLSSDDKNDDGMTQVNYSNEKNSEIKKRMEDKDKLPNSSIGKFSSNNINTVQSAALMAARTNLMHKLGKNKMDFNPNNSQSEVKIFKDSKGMYHGYAVVQLK
jgi:hypothetical protein